MDKRYQVFVSSTYDDLREERQEVMRALLELDCIPAGMELFPAANEAQWDVIKKVIAECDYYVVISAGRYGSIGQEGQGYTEMEYRYAVDIGRPVIAFLHENPMELPANKVEETDEGRERLRIFRELLKQKLCKYWRTADELGSVVSRSLVRLIKTAPATGWIRADEAAEELSAGEILRLRKRIDELEGRLREARISAPPGSERLAQGDDQYTVRFTFDVHARDDSHFSKSSWNYNVDLSWNQIFYDVGPLMINEIEDDDLRGALNKTVRTRSYKDRLANVDLKKDVRDGMMKNFHILEHDFQTIKVQLRALGLIAKSEKPRSVKDQGTYWTLTPYGDQVLTTLRAIPKATEPAELEEMTEDDQEES
jgi:hypothetical protein